MDAIDADFRKTCRMLFGQEIGALPEFAPYLSETNWPYVLGKSCVSGKEVMLSGPHYPKGAKFASYDEVPALPANPFSINEIKDIDSLFSAAAERAVYCGNKIFGKSINVAHSDNIVDGIEVHKSHDIFASKYVAYCSVGRYSESIYGVNNFNGALSSIRCNICLLQSAQRCFETHITSGISDSYYTINCNDSSDLMFCFNLRHKSRCIGNLQLSRERYSSLKQKLVSEMAEKLKCDKRLFSMAELLSLPGSKSPQEEKAWEREPVLPQTEKDLSEALKVIAGKEHPLAGKYAGWLAKRAVKVRKAAGANGEPVFLYNTPMFKGIPAKRLVQHSTALNNPGKGISLEENEDAGLEGIIKRVRAFATTTLEFNEGQSMDVAESPVRYDSVWTSNLWFSLHSKHSGISSIVTDSDHCFGGYIRVLNCDFCVSCDNITRCTRCFECDSCYSCTSCYFCHNCENVEEGILCFNLKGARYAVLNQQVPREEYMRIKQMLLGYINSELEKKGELGRSIFSLAHPEPKQGGNGSCTANRATAPLFASQKEGSPVAR